MTLMRTVFLSTLLVLAAGCSSTQIKKQTVAYEVLPFMQFPYASFVKNWDSEKQPVLTAFIDTPQAYGTFFSPAATGLGNQGSDKKEFEPAPETFKTHSFILVARVTPYPGESGSWTVDSLEYDQGTLTLSYTSTPPADPSSFQVKDGFLVKIPKMNIHTIQLYENKKAAGVIHITQ